MKWVILVFVLLYLFVIVVASEENPYEGEDKVRNLTLIAKYKYDGYVVNEYFLRVRVPSGIYNIRNRAYFLVFEIQQERTLNNATLVFDNIFLYRRINNFFHKTTLTDIYQFDRKFYLYSDEPVIIRQIFNERTSGEFLKLVEDGLIEQPPTINTFAISANRIQVRLLRLRVTYEIGPTEFIQRYNLSPEESIRIVKLLTGMASNLNDNVQKRDNQPMEVEYINPVIYLQN